MTSQQACPGMRSTSQERCYKHVEFKLQQGHPPLDRYPQTDTLRLKVLCEGYQAVNFHPLLQLLVNQKNP